MTEQLEKPLAKAQVIPNVLDYIKAADYIDSVLGYSQRDAHTVYPEQGEYLDYWHYVMDDLFDGDFSNDTFVRGGLFSFASFYQDTLAEYGEADWRTIIAKVWADEYPDEYKIWMSW